MTFWASQNDVQILPRYSLRNSGRLSHQNACRESWCPTCQATLHRHNCSKTRSSKEFFLPNLECSSTESGLLKKFRESVFEIFSNAVIHSQTKLGIFSCGQYFPKRHRLDFSFADLGIGIRQNVLKNAELDLRADLAIAWATDGQNTTKRGRIPGGLGLKLLREFITLNGGRIQIVSDTGYWSLEAGQVHTAQIRLPFPGTVVSIEIDTADKRSYKLSSELSETDIF